MRIGINILFIVPTKVGGTEISTKNVLKQIEKIDNKNEYFVFLNEKLDKVFNFSKKNIKKVVYNTSQSKIKRILFEQFVLPFIAIKYKLDVIYSLGNYSPVLLFLSKIKMITRMAALDHYHYPKNYSLLGRLALKYLTPLSLKVSDKIVAISKYCKTDISKVLKIDPEKISVIYLSCNRELFHPISDGGLKERVRNRYNMPHDYILSTAAVHAHKNLDNLIRAYSILKSEYKIGSQLVLVGPKGRVYKEIDSLIKKLKLQSDVKLAGWIPNDEMPVIYANAKVFVFPSKFEGFGAPPLEAQAVGIPVVSTDKTAIKEVVDNSVIIFDPDDPKDMAEKIYIMLNDDDIQREYIEKGFKNIERFSYRKHAEELINLFNSFK